MRRAEAALDRIVSIDGLLFALFYALTGIAMIAYFRRMAVAGPRNAVSLLLVPLVSTAFLLYVVWKSIPGLGGWTSGSLLSLYVLGAGPVPVTPPRARRRAG